MEYLKKCLEENKKHFYFNPPEVIILGLCVA